MSHSLDGFRNQVTPDGDPLTLFTLRNENGFEATFMDWGATWLSCLVPLPCGGKRETLLRSATFSDHLSHSVYFGATIGRYANRIRGGTFQSNDETFALMRNHFQNTLHGGSRGFDRHRWEGVEEDDRTVIFTRRSPDGEEGFPGTLDVKVTYALGDENQLVATYEATTDQRTPVNLTNHAYFNLSGDPTILDHRLTIHADAFLPVDQECIPTGNLEPVAGTDFDFRAPRAFRDPAGDAIPFDHSFLLRAEKTPIMKNAARLCSPSGDLILDIATDKPALQLYNGEHLEGLPGRGGKPLRKFPGLALETQFLPDSPNREASLNRESWPHETSFLDPGRRYRYQTIFRFIAQEN